MGITVTNKVSVLSVVMWLLAVLYLQLNKETTAFRNSQINMQVPKGQVLSNCHIHSKAHSPPSASQRSGTGSAWLYNEVADALHHGHHGTVAYKTRPLMLDSSFPLSQVIIPSEWVVVWATCRSRSHCAAKAGSRTTSAGASAGMATNSKLGFPISFLATPEEGLFKVVVTFWQNVIYWRFFFLWKTIDFA